MNEDGTLLDIKHRRMIKKLAEFRICENIIKNRRILKIFSFKWNEIDTKYARTRLINFKNLHTS